jgi:hypothetical protein
MAQTKIEIAGIEYRLGLGFLNELISGMGKRLDQMGDEDEVTLLPKLMYYARRYADIRANREVDYTLDDIFDYVDDNGGRFGEIAIEFHNAYVAAMTQDVPIDDKKKVTVKKK